MPRINVELDETLHRQVKVAAASMGVTLKEFVVEALRQAVVADKGPELTRRPRGKPGGKAEGR